MKSDANARGHKIPPPLPIGDDWLDEDLQREVPRFAGCREVTRFAGCTEATIPPSPRTTAAAVDYDLAATCVSRSGVAALAVSSLVNTYGQTDPEAADELVIKFGGAARAAENIFSDVTPLDFRHPTSAAIGELGFREWRREELYSRMMAFSLLARCARDGSDLLELGSDLSDATCSRVKMASTDEIRCAIRAADRCADVDTASRSDLTFELGTAILATVEAFHRAAVGCVAAVAERSDEGEFAKLCAIVARTEDVILARMEYYRMMCKRCTKESS